MGRFGFGLPFSGCIGAIEWLLASTDLDVELVTLVGLKVGFFSIHPFCCCLVCASLIFVSSGKLLVSMRDFVAILTRKLSVIGRPACVFCL